MRSLLFCLLLAGTAAAQDEFVGRRFMLTPTAQPVANDGKFDWHRITFPVLVKAVKGEWLDIGPARVKMDDVIPLEHAAQYFTEYLEQNPTSTWGYNSRAIVWKQWGELEKAIEDYSTAIRLNPRYAWAYSNRGNILQAKGDLDAALKDFSEAIRLDPTYAGAYYRRGNIYRTQSQLDAALKDYDEAIRLDPALVGAFNNRGITWKAKGDVAAALKDYEETVRLNPDYALGYSNMAWIRATASDAAFRDGKRAVEEATKACELTFWKDVAPVRTLAAANAEAGDFNAAIQWQTKAIELISEKSKPAEQSRLKLYLAGKPYRERVVVKTAVQ